MLKSMLVVLAAYLSVCVSSLPFGSLDYNVTRDFFKADHDVLIIGGGPAGLQAAMSLGRLRRSAMVFDSNEFRNQGAIESHDVILMDGMPADKLRRIARSNLLSYSSVAYRPVKIASVDNVANGTLFVATDTNGTRYTGRKIVIATGMKNVLPNITGMADIFGAGAIICPWCDSWERRDAPVAALGLGSVYEALLIGNLNRDSITILTNGVSLNDAQKDDPDKQKYELLAAANLTVESRPIKSVEFVDPTTRKSSVRVRFNDDAEKIYRVILLEDVLEQRSDLAGRLGVPMNPARSNEYLTRSISSDTDVFGVFVAGDLASTRTNIINSMNMAKTAAIRLVSHLSREDARVMANLPWRG